MAHKPYRVSLSYLVDYEVVIDANTPEEAESIAEQMEIEELAMVGKADLADICAYEMDDEEQE